MTAVAADETPSFGVRDYVVDGTTVVALEGELDLVSVPDADRALSAAQAAAGAVVLDLRSLSFLDSSGLRVILGAHRRADEAGAGATFAVAPGSGEVRRVFELSGVGGLLTLVDHPPPEPAS